MLYWTVGLLALDMALMGGVLYILLSKKNKSADRLAAAYADHSFAGASHKLIEKIKGELDTAKRLSTELDRKRRMLDGYEKALDEKNRALDGILNDAKSSYVTTGPLPRKRQAGDVYKKAMTMINKGAPVDEVTDMLGLLSGEAELISSVNRFKGEKRRLPR